jgi:DNA-binding NtrC family response regulator
MKKYPASVLIIDDDDHVVFTSKMILKDHFEKIETLDSPKTLEAKLNQQKFDVILLDMNFKAGATSGNEGLFWLNRITELAPDSQVVLQTAYGDIDLAVRSMKEGAVDFLPKPWDKEKLVSTIFNAYQQALAKKETRGSRKMQNAVPQMGSGSIQPFIAVSSSMAPVLHAIEQVAQTEAAVLILGENGTGKEIVARSIHERSARSNEPFVKVDVGSLSASLFESEIFGHEKGAFTDAKEPRIGKFELAHRGSLFLDEVGNLPPSLQVKLLTALQSKTITRVGGNHAIPLDIRVICATNAPIYELVRDGSFRQDLFYRIKTVEIPIPPLRDRKEDIPLLFDYYFKEFKEKYRKSLDAPRAVVDRLVNYYWPGNIRELQHAVERAVILCRTPELRIQDFQLVSEGNYGNSFSSLKLADVEREVIQKAILKHQNNLTRAAEDLGIGRTTLYRKLEEYGLNNNGQ